MIVDWIWNVRSIDSNYCAITYEVFSSQNLKDKYSQEYLDFTSFDLKQMFLVT